MAHTKKKVNKYWPGPARNPRSTKVRPTPRPTTPTVGSSNWDVWNATIGKKK